MDQVPYWAWYNDEIALVVEVDDESGFCELQLLQKNSRDYQGKQTHLLDETKTLASLTDVDPYPDIVIEEIKYDLFIVDDGDEDYVPSDSESSESDVSDMEDERQESE